ncbi:MarR family winged helix-turn-helix transcriptional regulator [Nocardia sp. NBC_01377]|uniref:MarR family winged helix-turn-helix transcriptional regulator n=1 Tax=Nocardia sp. NBC_01377 TaxID=2903595 RepID=UPI00324B12EE
MTERTTERQLREAGTLASRRLAGAVAQLERHRRHQEQAATIKTADMRLLWLFSDRRPRTLRCIVDDLGLERSTVNRQVNAAMAAGLLRRYRNSAQSAHLIEATEAGLAAFEEEVRDVLESYDLAIARFDPADAQRLLDLFDRFVDVFGEIVRADV